MATNPARCRRIDADVDAERRRQRQKRCLRQEEEREQGIQSIRVEGRGIEKDKGER